MENLVIIKTLEEMQELQTRLSDAEYWSFDTETTGVEKESEIIGFSIASDVETGYYVILSGWNVEKQALDYYPTKEGAKAFMQALAERQLVMQNAGFDCMMVKNNYGVDLMPSLFADTMIMAHLLDENRPVGLKELGVVFFGADAKAEQDAMKASVHANGGQLTRGNYELYKGDADLIAKYGAKDAVLTMMLFYQMVPDLYDQGLDKFYFEDESMPLLKGPTYDLNSTGLKVDPEKLQILKNTLEAECLEAKAFIYSEITPHVKDTYPGTTPTKTFNISSSKQLSWLMFEILKDEFHTLTKEGRELCHALDLKLPYAFKDKRQFIEVVRSRFGTEWKKASWNPKTKKMGRPKKVGNWWNYIACGKETLSRYSDKYKWVKSFLEYAKNQKLLNTYVEVIQERMRYNVIRPSFLQHGTTSGRYSSKAPNFQNLPRDDKRVKACIVARPGKVFVGADYSQLEPRVFASVSGDERLLRCFESGEDFYSVIGAEVFGKVGYSLVKNDPGSFAEKFPELRQIAKTIALAATYGTTAPKMAPLIKKSMDEAQEVIDNYFEAFPSVRQMMMDSHEMAKTYGQVQSLYGRLRRMPAAKEFRKIYGNAAHGRLPYEARKLLNLAVNHRIQSTGASIMNRAAISTWKMCRAMEAENPAWAEVKLILQVHDELILEGPESLSDEMVEVLKAAMEQTVELPGVSLIAEPKVARNLADLK